MSYQFTPLEIPEVVLIESPLFTDDRGFFMEVYKESVFRDNGLNLSFVQESHSQSKKNILRGLHYQLNPKAQGKLVRVTRGRAFDVAVDIREGSPTFGKWVGAELTESNCLSLWIPVGFAHGFISLEDKTDFLYKTTGEYSPEHERSIIWNDPSIGIDWPVKDPVVGAKDAQAPALKEAEYNFTYQQ